MGNEHLSPAKRALLEKLLMGQSGGDMPTILPRPANSPITLSFPQQRQLFLEILERGTAVNNLSVLLNLSGKIDHQTLEQSANHIIARHEVLRTRFLFGQGMPTPEILPASPISIPIVDLRQSNQPEKINEARRLAEKEVLKPFDLTQAPLIRLKLYALSEEHYSMLVIIHHTIADGWSLGIFLRELMMFYEQITSGRHASLPPLPIQYSDFANWQIGRTSSEGFKSAMNYWKKQLQGPLPVLDLPTDEQRGPRQRFSGRTERFVLTRDLIEAVEKLCRQEDVTLFMVMLTTFYILLHRYSGQDEILVGTPIANRNLPELENLIGVFINTLVLRTKISGECSFRELLQRVREVSVEAYTHQDLPFEKLVEELNPQRDLSRTPVFQVVFNMQNSPLPKLENNGFGIGFTDLDRGVSQFDLTLMMSKAKGQCYGVIEYNRDLFNPATITRMCQSFQMLLADAIANPTCAVSKLQLISIDDWHHLVHELNRTEVHFPREKCVHHLFEAQVEKTPDGVAVVYEQVMISYSGLNDRANQLACHLQKLGVCSGVRVGILMEKSLETVVALLAVLKAGGTYVPISASFPDERVQFILEDAEIRVLLTNVDSFTSNRSDVQVVNLNERTFSAYDGSAFPETNITADDLAYIIYTSGSTGQPKGVMVQHSALVNFLWSMRSRPGINSDDRLLTVTPISFDIAALEMFLPLITGATLVILKKEITANPHLLGKAIEDHNVTIMQATPATWQLLVDSGWSGPSLKALCGGEALTRKLADQLLERVGVLWNMYGPTETTVWSSVGIVQQGNTPVTIGQPIGNTQLYILDPYQQPVPTGVTGELYIGGEGLAKGYLNQPVLTNEKFIPDCFIPKPGNRLYKTGDHARYLPDHSIEILGRADDQVKINGHRIELGEIKSVLLLHSQINDAVVITRTESSGDKKLVAYYVSDVDQAPSSGELQEFVRKKLPAYMMPSVFIRLNNIPLSPNGKVDRKALKEPDDLRHANEFVAPRNEMEQILADIWQSVLQIERVGVHDNFFDLGGASIQSMQLVASAGLAGIPLSAESIFEHQTIAELAGHLKNAEETVAFDSTAMQA